MGLSTWIHTINDDQINFGYCYPITPEDRNFPDVSDFVKYLQESDLELIFDINYNDAQYISVVLDKDILMKIFKSIMNGFSNKSLEENLNLLTSNFSLVNDLERLVNRCKVFPRFQISWSY